MICPLYQLTGGWNRSMVRLPKVILGSPALGDKVIGYPGGDRNCPAVLHVVEVAHDAAPDDFPGYGAPILRITLTSFTAPEEVRR